MWLLSVGFVLSFGAMFSKTWRVYRIATFKKPKRVVRNKLLECKLQLKNKIITNNAYIKQIC